MASQGIQYAQDVRRQFSGPSSKVGWPKSFLTFSFVIFATVFFIYLGLAFGYQSFLNASINNIEEELGTLSSQISEQQKDDLTALFSQVTNIKTLLQEHSVSSQVFLLLESITSENVYYTNFDLSVPDQEAIVEGFAASYEELVSQLALFEEAPQIEKLTLEESEFQNGLIRFKLRLLLAEEILTPSAS